MLIVVMCRFKLWVVKADKAVHCTRGRTPFRRWVKKRGSGNGALGHAGLQPRDNDERCRQKCWGERRWSEAVVLLLRSLCWKRCGRGLDMLTHCNRLLVIAMKFLPVAVTNC
jgi:hypothetical protein